MDKVEQEVRRAEADAKLADKLERRAKASDAARTDQPGDTPRPDPQTP